MDGNQKLLQQHSKQIESAGGINRSNSGEEAGTSLPLVYSASSSKIATNSTKNKKLPTSTTLNSMPSTMHSNKKLNTSQSTTNPSNLSSGGATTSNTNHVNSTSSSLLAPIKASEIEININTNTRGILQSDTKTSNTNSGKNKYLTSNNKKIDINNNTNRDMDENVDDDIEDIDQDDASSPFKSGVNTSNANSNILKSDLINLSNENENKMIRKSRGKNIFKSLFCCFTPTHRNNRKPTHHKNGSILQNATNIGPTTNSTNLNTNNTTITTSTSNNNINSVNTNTNSINNNSNLLNQKNEIHNNNDNLNAATNNNNNIDPYKNIITSVNSNSNNSNFNYLNNVSNNYEINNDHLHHNLPEKHLLSHIRPSENKKCLIIDLDETLVHSSFKQVHNADFIVPVEIDGNVHQVYVLKRPYVDEFLKRMGELFECVLFTASLAKYADPVADLLDKWGVFKARLFREACVYYRGNYVKDLSRLGRDLNKVIILDNSPASYIFHPENAVSCTSWFEDIHDTELIDLIPHFERLAMADSVYHILKQSTYSSPFNTNNQTINSNVMQHQQNYTNQTTNQNATTSLYIQQQQFIANNSNNKENYDESLNQQVPGGIGAQQTLLYQQQQQQNDPSNNNNNTSAQNNYNYLLNENKILLSIDLMMASKQQQLQQQQQQQQQSGKQSYQQQYNIQN